MKIFIVKDTDTKDVYAFKKRKNAIDFMYRKCREWGATLYTSVVAHGLCQYTELGSLYGTDEKQLDYLYMCSESELCDIFDAYWIFRECEFEDEDEEG